MSQDLISRQQFMRQGLGQLMSGLSSMLPLEEIKNVEVEKPFHINPSPNPNALRPPGALIESEFIKACEPHCHACSSACPRQAIQVDAAGFPFIQPEEAPCVMCVDIACTKVCPTEALQPLYHVNDINLGTAVIELTACTAFQGSGCQICVNSCPLLGEAIQLNEGLPEILAAGCTGCGICVYDCPTPGAIVIQANTATILS